LTGQDAQLLILSALVRTILNTKRNTTMKKIISIALLTLGLARAATAQSTYDNSIGVRIGTGYYDIFSASFKTFLSSGPSALEFDLGFKPQTYGYGVDALNLSFSAAYQYLFDISALPGLKWFIGGGLSGYNTFVNANQYYHSGFGLGIFPTGGADYKFGKIPLAISLDFRPTFGLIRPNDYYSLNFFSLGLSARYTF